MRYRAQAALPSPGRRLRGRTESGARGSASARIVPPMERQLFFSGNEAIAHGAVRAGARFACGYPGTPSTEIIEATARLEGIHSEWCVNEKVALETAVGASLAGVRTIVTMKHVGLNVAADPFMTLSLTGVNARPRHHQRRRPRHALVAERAGQPQLREVRQDPDARALRQPGGLRLRRRGVRALRGVRHAGHAADDDADLARPRAGAAARAGRGGAARLRAGHQQVRHGPAVRAAAEPARPRAPREAAEARRRRARSTCSRRAPRTSASSPPASRTPTPARRSPRPGSSSWACRTRCPTPRSRASTTTSRASRSSRSSTRSSRSRCARSACR